MSEEKFASPFRSRQERRRVRVTSILDWALDNARGFSDIDGKRGRYVPGSVKVETDPLRASYSWKYLDESGQVKVGRRRITRQQEHLFERVGMGGNWELASAARERGRVIEARLRHWIEEGGFGDYRVDKIGVRWSPKGEGGLEGEVGLVEKKTGKEVVFRVQDLGDQRLWYLNDPRYWEDDIHYEEGDYRVVVRGRRDPQAKPSPERAAQIEEWEGLPKSFMEKTVLRLEKERVAEERGLASATGEDGGQTDLVGDTGKDVERYRMIMNQYFQQSGSDEWGRPYVPGSLKIWPNKEEGGWAFSLKGFTVFGDVEGSQGELGADKIKDIEADWKENSPTLLGGEDALWRKVTRRMKYEVNDRLPEGWRVKSLRIRRKDGEHYTDVDVVGPDGKTSKREGERLTSEMMYTLSADSYWEERGGEVIRAKWRKKEKEKGQIGDGLAVHIPLPRGPRDPDDQQPGEDKTGEQKGQLTHMKDDKQGRQEMLGSGAAALILPKVFKAFLKMTPQGRVATGLGAAFGAFRKAQAEEIRSEALREAFGEELTKEQRGGFSRMMTPPGRNPAFNIKGER